MRASDGALRASTATSIHNHDFLDARLSREQRVYESIGQRLRAEAEWNTSNGPRKMNLLILGMVLSAGASAEIAERGMTRIKRIVKV